jgi:hypothetical protein
MTEELLTKEVEELIDALYPGDHLDLLISKIMGDKKLCPYSTDIKASWKIVEWCMDYAGTGDLFIEFWNDDEWFICSSDLYSRKMNPGVIAARSDKVNGDDGEKPSFPLAICRYALKAGIKQALITAKDITIKGTNNND